MLSETLLDVASFLDYASLVVLRLTSKQLLGIADKYAEKLAFRRTFSVTYLKPVLTIKESRVDDPHAVVHRMELRGTHNERLHDVADALQSHIGPHAIRGIYLYELNFSLTQLVDLVPPLRFALELHLQFANGSLLTSQEYSDITLLFDRLVWAGFCQIPVEALVVFLQSASASRLTGWSALAPAAERNLLLDAAVEDTVFRACFNLTREQGQPWKVAFVGWYLRWNFLRRLIEVMKETVYLALDMEFQILIRMEPMFFSHSVLWPGHRTRQGKGN